MRLKISKRLRQQLLQNAIAVIPGETDHSEGEFLTKREIKALLLSYLEEHVSTRVVKEAA